MAVTWKKIMLAGDNAADLGSGAATDGYVLTADGIGGADWEAQTGGGVDRINFIINGLGEVYQRNAAYTLVKDVYGAATDRFFGMATGTAVSAGTLVQATAAPCGRTGYAHHFSGVTLTGTGVIYLRYRVEAKDAVAFKNQNASFSAKVYQDTGGAVNYTVYIRKANSADTFSAVTNISNSGALSIPNSAETTLAYQAIAMGDCSNGIEIEIKIECGAITTKNFYFTELQFEIGSVSTAFNYRSYHEELNLCMRYFQQVPDGTDVYGEVGIGNASNSTTCYIGFQFFVPMIGPPALTSSGNFRVDDTAAAYAVTSIAKASATKQKTLLGIGVASGLTQYRTYKMSANNDATAKLMFNSEL